MSEARADDLGVQPLARFVSYAVSGVPPQLMGIGPVTAVPKALKLARMQLGDIDLIELNEAFAAQALAVMHELGLDEAITNVNGGAIALGHPLGCTGAKLTVQLLHELQRPRPRVRPGNHVHRRRHGRGGHPPAPTLARRTSRCYNARRAARRPRITGIIRNALITRTSTERTAPHAIRQPRANRPQSLAHLPGHDDLRHDAMARLGAGRRSKPPVCPTRP